MRQSAKNVSEKSHPSSSSGDKNNSKGSEGNANNVQPQEVVVAKRPARAVLLMFVLAIYGAWSVYRYRFERLPIPCSAEQVGKRGFSEDEAMKHLKALTQLGPHLVGSDAIDRVVQYVLEASEAIKEKAHWEVDVEVDLFHVKSGASSMGGGLFKGKTLAYSDLNHVILRISPKYVSEAKDNAILVSSHIDTGKVLVMILHVWLLCSSLLVEFLSGFMDLRTLIFLFNTGEEEGLNGAHSFITQAGPHPWAIENFAAVAKCPSGDIVAQDIFASGAINSATDFQVYKEVAGLSGLDFAYVDNTTVYHTKNDKLSLVRPGSLQHLGDNMLAFLLQAADSAGLPKSNGEESGGTSGEDTATYFDILMACSKQLYHRSPKPLKTLTLLMGLSIPFVISSGVFIRLAAAIIGNAVRFDRKPGATPEWLVSLILAVYVAAVICLTMVYLLSYIHISGAKVPIIVVTCLLFGLSLCMVSVGIIPPFTENTSRPVNVVHVVDTTGKYGEKQEPFSYVSLFSTTPRDLMKEVKHTEEKFVCGRDKPLDYVTFSVEYGCLMDKGAEIGWHSSDIPVLHVESDIKGDDRITQVLIDTKSSIRWALGINTEVIEDFQIKDDAEELIPVGDKSSVDGWRIIQFLGGKEAPTKFSLTLFWLRNHTQVTYPEGGKEKACPFEITDRFRPSDSTSR